MQAKQNKVKITRLILIIPNKNDNSYYTANVAECVLKQNELKSGKFTK